MILKSWNRQFYENHTLFKSLLKRILILSVIKYDLPINQGILMRTFFIQLLVLATVLGLSGCATAPNNQGKGEVNQVQELKHWTASGKILIVENGDKQSANFNWRQSGNDYTFNLSTFLGIDIFSLKSKNGLVTIEVDGKTYQGNYPEQLLFKLTRHQIPIKHLQFWLLGYANSDKAMKKVFDDNNLLRSFEFASLNNSIGTFSTSQLSRLWQIKYQSRHQNMRFQLPQLVSIRSDNTRIKLSISRWHF